MPLTFPNVASIAGAISTGIMRTSNWMFAELENRESRMRFLSNRFPDLPQMALNELYHSMQLSSTQSRQATQSGRMPGREEMFIDPTTRGIGRFAYHVKVTASGWRGDPQGRQSENLFTYHHIAYSDSELSMSSLDERVKAFVDEIAKNSRERNGPTRGYRIEAHAYTVTTITRAF